MRLVLRTTPLLALAFLAGFLPARAQPREAFRLEGRLPASTLLFASLEDVTGGRERAKQTALQRMAEDPEMKAFLDPLRERIEAMLQEHVLAQVPPPLLELLQHLQHLEGQAAIALVDVDLERELPLAVAVLDFGDHVQAFQAFLLQMIEQVPGGARTVQLDGRPAWQVPLGDLAVTAVIVDTAVVLATDEDLLRRVLAGPVEDALGAQQDFRAVRGRAGGDQLIVHAYANVAAALARFGPMMAGGGPEVPRIASALGLDTVRAVGYGLSVQGDGFRETLSVHAPGADHGLVPLYAMKPLRTPSALDLVPAKAFYFAEANFPFSTVLPRWHALATAMDPEAGAEMGEGLAMVRERVGVDLQEEILSKLADSYAVWASFPEMGGLYPEVAAVLRVQDPPTFEASFGRLVEGLAGLINEEGDVIARTRTIEYHGVRLHLLDLRAADGSIPIPFTPTWAMLGDRLVVTLVPYTLKDVVLRKEEGAAGLASQEDFQALLRLKPSEAGAIGYLDLQAILALLYDTGVPLAQTLLKPNVLRGFEVDWALLPPARRLMPYFRSMASYTTWTDDGVVLAIQGPFPALPVLAGYTAAVAAWGMSMDRAHRVAVARGRAIEWEDDPGWVGGEPADPAAVDEALIEAADLAGRVALFREERGRMPTGWPDLVSAGFIEHTPMDPWGGLYRLVSTPGQDRIVVESAGPDHIFGTADDVRYEEE